MTVNELNKLAEDYPYIKIFYSDEERVLIEFKKKEETKESLESLGYSFESGM